ncbi:MAG: type II toxin-antitoxin system HicA family toxin [Mesorhizobium sp.]|nr:MAG: type II toxin-antitoxin system HicA family toxin [Mesorhizobium sp.]
MEPVQKLCDAIRNNPKDIRFSDACKVAEKLGYVKGGTGGHTAYARPGDPIGLNFQKKKDGKIPAYQGEQLVDAIERHEARLSNET